MSIDLFFSDLVLQAVPLYNNDIRWQQPNPNPAGPCLAYPIISAQPPVSTEYTYYQLMPAPCAQVLRFLSSFPCTLLNTFQAANTVNTIATECTERQITLDRSSHCLAIETEIVIEDQWYQKVSDKFDWLLCLIFLLLV